MLKTPNFWNQTSGLASALKPFSWLYSQASHWRESRVTSERVSVPVICVGNLVMGGAGKTPTVMALTEILQKLGHTPHILSRGYGACVRGVVQVDPDYHSYLQVGDEPLMLSRLAPTWVGVNRVKSAKAAIARGATILVMDDGLQNPRLHKDFRIVVVDAIQGFGNKNVFPAGPLREPLEKGLKRADALVVIGERDPFKKPPAIETYHAHLQMRDETAKPDRVIGFAGLGYPEKFRQTLARNHYDVCEFIAFADHHPYTRVEAQRLIDLAALHNAKLITTEKDWMRFPLEFREQIDVLSIRLSFQEIEALEENIQKRFPIFNKQ